MTWNTILSFIYDYIYDTFISIYKIFLDSILLHLTYFSVLMPVPQYNTGYSFLVCWISGQGNFTVLFETLYDYYYRFTLTLYAQGPIQRMFNNIWIQKVTKPVLSEANTLKSSSLLPYEVLDQCQQPFFLHTTLRKCRMESSSKKRNLWRIKLECLLHVRPCQKIWFCRSFPPYLIILSQ